jgi:Rps23 Pro-64 3,4-dihydroxylase Tpa1-like proline 4-hydroxylase
MKENMHLDGRILDRPFPHVRIAEALPEEQAEQVLAWLEQQAPWSLCVADFYEQEEFSLLESEPSEVRCSLVDPSFLETLQVAMRDSFGLPIAPVVTDVTAHRLTSGQTIRIHNDFIGGEETHRLLIQLNNGWTAEQGGLFMLFSSQAPDDVHSVIVPRHRSALAFEITPRSYHAVSQIKSGERYTLVYSFKASP